MAKVNIDSNTDQICEILKEIKATMGNHKIIIDNIVHPRDVDEFTKLFLEELKKTGLTVHGGTKHRIIGSGYMIKVYRSNQGKAKLEQGIVHILKWNTVVDQSDDSYEKTVERDKADRLNNKTY